jgi:hypothetical protein
MKMGGQRRAALLWGLVGALGALRYVSKKLITHSRHPTPGLSGHLHTVHFMSCRKGPLTLLNCLVFDGCVHVF